MSFLFSNEFLNEIRNRINVSDIVGRYVKLRRTGSEYEGLCPFHNEKTPSFTVNDQKGFYHCFGCGAHGDVIRFLVDSRGYKFFDAVEELARDAGLELPKKEEKSTRTQKQLNEIEEIYKALEAACDYYEKQLLLSTDASGYIKSRDISKEDIKKFRIGYAPIDSDAQINHLRQMGFSINILEKAGLLSKRENSNKARNNYYAKFRNRIMFPIMDQKNRVIAFGGRVIHKDDKPKYLNSPETMVFHKGYNLYAQNLAKIGIREKLDLKAIHGKDNISNNNSSNGNHNHNTTMPMPLIVCEGYTDTIALHKAGLSATVAPLGTAITEDQLRIMWRLHNSPIFCLDGDNAGYRAAIRACERAVPIIKTGKNLQFVFLPQGEDPDTYIKKYGIEKFLEQITKGRMDMFELLWKSIYYKHNKGQSVSESAALRRDTESIIESTTDKSVAQSLRTFFKAKIFEIEKALFKSKNNNSQRYNKSINVNSKGTDNKKYGATQEQQDKYFSQKLLLMLAVKNPDIIEDYYDEFSGMVLEFDDLSKIQQEILNAYEENKDPIYETVKANTNLFQNQKDELIRIERLGKYSPKRWKMLYDSVIYLRDLRKELESAKLEYSKEPTTDNLEKIATLFNIIEETEKKQGELALCNSEG